MNADLKEKYSKIFQWYTSNKDKAPTKSLDLINNFPVPEVVSQLEMKCVFSEVIGGNLEYASRNGYINELSLFEYALLTYGKNGFIHLSKKELNEVKKSKLYPYLSHLTIPMTATEIEEASTELLKEITSKRKKR